VERYFEVMHSRDMVTKMMDAMIKPMHEMMHQQFQRSGVELPPEFEARMNKRMDEMIRGMDWAGLMDAMVPAYQRHLTKGDIDALVAFYGTPTGQKILREMPAMMAESMKEMMPLLQSSMEAMQKGLKDDIDEMVRQEQAKKKGSGGTKK
jgi:uncharacterized protein